MILDCLFGGVKLAGNADPEKYVYTSYGIGFGLRWKFSLPESNMGKNVIIFRVEMSSYKHIDNKQKRYFDI